jgi:hypothetical protein
MKPPCLVEGLNFTNGDSTQLPVTFRSSNSRKSSKMSVNALLLQVSGRDCIRKRQYIVRDVIRSLVGAIRSSVAIFNKAQYINF